MRLSARCLLTVLATAVSVSAHEQAEHQAGSGALAITVRESGSGALLPDVRITASRSGRPAVTGTTTGDGTLRLTLTPGQYTIYAHSEGHLTGYGHPSAGLIPPPPPRVQKDEAVVHETGVGALTIRRDGNHRMAFELPRASSIQGFVLSEEGRPLPNLDVELHRVVQTAGERRLARWANGKTGALGHFRLAGVFPGDYLVRVRFGSARGAAYNDSYYPGVSDPARAVPVTIRPGHDESLTLTTPLLPLGSIAGTVTGPASAISRVELTYQQLGEDTGCVIVHMLVPVGRDGRFSVTGLTSGRYALRAAERVTGGARPEYGAVRIVDVGPAPLVDVNVPLQAYATLRGRFEFHGISPTSALFHSVDVLPVGPDAPARHDGSSRYLEMPGDEFGLVRILGLNRMHVSAPDGWIVEAVVLADGTDVYDTPFAFEPGRHYSDVRVVMSDRTATLKGRIVGATTPSPAPGMMVVAVPDDETPWARPHHVLRGSVQNDGSFRISNVRPGRTYLVAGYAWPASAEGDAWYAQHARSATRIHVTGPGAHTVDVRPAR